MEAALLLRKNTGYQINIVLFLLKTTYPDKVNNIEAIIVVRISIRIIK